jgi:hypothetical protein
MFIRYLVRGVVDVEVRWDDKLAKFAGEVTEAMSIPIRKVCLIGSCHHDHHFRLCSPC